jgi:hypothetical protein
VSEDLRERVDALTWAWETAMLARLQHEDMGRESLASIYRGYEKALSALLSAPEPAEPGADMPVRAMVEEVDHLREALYTIAFYDPDEVRRSGVTPTDMRDIARNALARSLATREEMEEADTDG